MRPASWQLGLLLLVVTLVVAPSLGGGWVWDDHGWASAPPDFGVLLHGQGSLWRPLGSLPVLALHALGAPPVVHRLWSLGLHLVAVLLVLDVALRAGARPPFALFAAACFGVHPAALETVGWISAQTEQVPAVLTLAGWSAWQRGRIGLGALCWALAPFGKEAWVLLPLGGLVWAWSNRGVRPFDLRLLAGALVGGALLLGARQLLPVSVSGRVLQPDPFAAAGWMAGRFVEVLLVPGRADIYARYTPQASLGWIAAAGVLGALLAARGRPWLGAMLLPLPVLAPNAIAVALNGFGGDRYYYLPLAGVAIGGALLAEAVAPRVPETARRPLRLAWAVPVLLALAGAARAVDWRDDRGVVGAALALDPANPWAAYFMGEQVRLHEGGCGAAARWYAAAAPSVPQATERLAACGVDPSGG